MNFPFVQLIYDNTYNNIPGSSLRILVITSEWPSNKNPISGIHIFNQITRLREAGVTVDVFHFRGEKNVIHYVQAIRKLKSIPLDGYQVIHAHHGQSGLVALAQRIRPVVITFHGSDLQGLLNNKGNHTFAGYILQAASRWAARKANKIILVAEHLEKYIPPRPYHVIPAGIDTSLFTLIPKLDARKELGFLPQENLILFVGDPSRPEKNFPLAQAVVEQVNRSISSRLVVANGVPNNRMPLYMNACDVLLITSKFEGSPNVVKEALACNLPIVSTDVGDIRRRIGSIQGCEVCDSNDPQSMADLVVKSLTTRQLIQSRDRILELDERILVQKVISIYEQVAALNAPRV